MTGVLTNAFVEDLLAIALSPNGTLAIAYPFDETDDTRPVGQPAIFPLPLTLSAKWGKREDASTRNDVKMEEDDTAIAQSAIHALGRALASCLFTKHSCVDLLMQLNDKSDGEWTIFIKSLSRCNADAAIPGFVR